MHTRKRAAVDPTKSEIPSKKVKTEPTRRSQRNQNKSTGDIPTIPTTKTTSKAPSNAKIIKPKKPITEPVKEDADLPKPKPTRRAQTNGATKPTSKSTTKALPSAKDTKREKIIPEPVKEDDDELLKSKPSRKPRSNAAPKKPKPSPLDSLPRPAYWLMKAEPETRIEKGKDVKFSIDDLAAVDKEPWDGVRNLVARNNMKAMKKGELAFFYHSNCKIPGIAGIMTIADEHSTDESAFNPSHPYYDEKSTRDNPKWSLVHVEFLKKLENLIPLKELQKYAKPGAELEGMQGLRMTRLSVSRVSRGEWEFICRELGGVDPASLEAINCQ